MGKRAVRRNKAKAKVSKAIVKKAPTSKINSKGDFKSFYDQNYKLLLLIPLFLIILSVAQISYQSYSTGDFINKGISLSGGISITINKEISISFSELEDYLNSELPNEDSSVRELSSSGRAVGLIVESTVDDSDKIRSLLENKIGVFGEGEYTEEVMGSRLGEQFFKQTFTALIFAFLLMGIVVFVYFRQIAPSIAVILSAVGDIIITAAIVNFTGMKLSTAGIAAFLMLIGYSVDTDILLSTKMVKGKGSINSRILDAMGTGLVMSITTIIAVTVAILVTQSIVIKQIMIIILIGLIVDLIMTWIQNASLLKWFLEAKK